jgi:hypothetical protein
MIQDRPTFRRRRVDAHASMEEKLQMERLVLTKKQEKIWIALSPEVEEPKLQTVQFVVDEKIIEEPFQDSDGCRCVVLPFLFGENILQKFEMLANKVRKLSIDIPVQTLQLLIYRFLPKKIFFEGRYFRVNASNYIRKIEGVLLSVEDGNLIKAEGVFHVKIVLSAKKTKYLVRNLEELRDIICCEI